MPAGVYALWAGVVKALAPFCEPSADVLSSLPPVAKKCTAGVMMSESTMEITTPPITAIARGCNICEPAPIAKDSGSIPASVASAVMTMGRSRLRLDADHHDHPHERRNVERRSGD